EHQDFALRVKRLIGDVREAYEDMVDFARELRSVAGETVPVKTVLFLEEMMNKEGSREEGSRKWQLRGGTFSQALMAFAMCSFCFVCASCSDVIDGEFIRRRGKRHLAEGLRRDRRVTSSSREIGENRGNVPERDERASTGGRMLRSEEEEITRLRGLGGRAAAEDRRFATQLNMLRREMANIYEKRRNLAYELRSFRGIIAPGKAVDFLNDALRKDDAEMTQLCELERQIELRALKKELFI
ncbi:hypothetical protein Tco_0371913, partial [Tanacetum coccineum]